MGALDELLAKWRDNPDSGTTLALCTYLGTSRREELIREVGSTAEAWHKDDGQVMLAVGRMYLDAGLLQEGQAALVVAGKLDQANPAPYRYLGEVLLRRGDAARAEKVLARALQIGVAAADTRMWHDRAVVYVALQTRVGMRAVADEIDRTVPKRTSIPPPEMMSLEEEQRPAPQRTAPRGRASPSAMPSVPPPPKLVSSQPPPLPRGTPEAYRAESYSEGDVPTGRFAVDEMPNHAARQGPQAAAAPAPFRAPVVPAPTPAPRAAPVMPSVPVPTPAPRAPVAPQFTQSAPVAPRFVAHAPAEHGPEFDDSPSPRAETVLEHLARVGVYERGGGAAPAWVAPARDKPRGTWFLVGAIVLSVGLGAGGFTYVRRVRQERMATARSIEADIKKQLETGKLDDLKKTDDELSHVFDLDSRSENAAILWLRNRVLSALMLPGEPRGIESALARCTTLAIDDSRTAFGRITSFLAEGDLAGAAALMPKWDERSKGDPFYQLAAGAMLERAGDARAIGRYEQAYNLDPDLNEARVFHAELVTLELGSETGHKVVDEAVAHIGDGLLARALQGLAWAVDPAAGPLPDSVHIADEDRGKLPTQLLAIPFVVDARAAALAGHTDDALTALDKALHLTATPAMATGIGQVAIDLGDEPLARQATLRALSFSAIYPRARSLAARVALLGGHIDEAKNAIQELDAKSPEVAVVRAAAAYEILDVSELESASAAMGSAEGTARALATGSGIVMGRKYPTAAKLEEMAEPSVPWGDLVAVDAALDTGNLDLAQKITKGWGERASTPTYALRLARLYRYLGKTEDAAKASSESVVAGGVTPRVLVERFACLLLAKDVAGARDLLGQYPAVLGPMTDFLKVSADVADGKAARAKATAARLEPPPEDSPLLYELIAAKAFAEVGDKRGKPMAAAILKSVPKHPDALAAAGVGP